MDTRPETVNRIHGDDIENIPARTPRSAISCGPPGDRIPLDGIVTEGESRIDTSPVTGEPVPVTATAGTEVVSGCVNEQGLLNIKVTKPLSESMVTRILDSVENAAAGKPKIDKFITKFAEDIYSDRCYLAVLTAIIPSLITETGANGHHRHHLPGNQLPLRACYQRASGILCRNRCRI